MDELQTANKKFRKELKAGTAALVLLGALDLADEPMYGYQITKRLDAHGDSGLDFKMGALYPVLRSLERSGMLTSEIEPSTSGPPRRYYQMTDVGREILVEWRETWGRTRDFVDAILKG